MRKVPAISKSCIPRPCTASSSSTLSVRSRSPLGIAPLFRSVFEVFAPRPMGAFDIGFSRRDVCRPGRRDTSSENGMQFHFCDWRLEFGTGHVKALFGFGGDPRGRRRRSKNDRRTQGEVSTMDKVSLSKRFTPSRRSLMLGATGLAASRLGMPYIGNAEAAEPIKLGMIWAKTGNIVDQAEYLAQGSLLALEQRNNMLLGRPVEVIW